MENLRDILYRKGYTQQDFANKLGVRQETVSRWVNGVTRPRADMLKKMSQILHVSIKDLIGG
jgi:transcriptional regulator with XRE-family HTH domain